jgi:predicted O-methyltransferase YrrM
VKKIVFIYHYIVHRLKATNEHGVHSPFVFNLLTNVIDVKQKYSSYGNIEKLREQLLSSKKTIHCIDLGAGTEKKADKQISRIAKTSAKSAKQAQLLFRLANHFQPSKIIELGTSLGISTAYLASANSKSQIITLEGCPETADFAQQNFKHLKLKNIQQVIGNFDDTLPKVLHDHENLEFVFFDGNHRKQATLNYFDQCLKKASDSTVFVFDDIYWSDEMMEAWNEIKNNDRVTVTIDLFFMGIVFFRKEQVKQHFLIRF